MEGNNRVSFTWAIRAEEKTIWFDELEHGAEIRVIRAEGRVEIETLEVVEDLRWCQRASHVPREHCYARSKPRGAAS